MRGETRVNGRQDEEEEEWSSRSARRNFLSCGHEASTWTQAGALRLCAPRGAATARRQNFPSSKQRFSDEDSQLV